jgi:NADPH:quinone reductase
MDSVRTLRGIVVREAGGPENLELDQLSEPTPGPGELLVDVEWAGVNFIDTYHRHGLYPLDFPFTPGVEGVGTVADVGADVANFSPGDRVGWINTLGTYAERHVVSSEQAIPIPGDVESDVAAAVLLQGITAHYLANDTFELSSGDRCLIHAGAGGVGLLLTQIAAMKGAEIITTVGSHEKADLSREAGAGEVIVYREIDFKDEVERLIGPHALDVVFDGVGAATFERSIDLLRPRGLMVSFGNASGPVPKIAPLTLSQKGSLFLTRPTIAHYIQTREILLGRAADLFDWIRTGALQVRIGHSYPLEQAADSHRALESRETTGKVLLQT